jgi:protein involved in polysaccharide export with SLBB domain
MMMARLLPIALMVALLGCSSAPPPALPSPVPSGPYVLQPGDRIALRFNRNQELNESVTIRPDGMISLQLIEEVPAAGMTPAALSDELGRRYAGELAHPDVNVIVESFSTHRVSVAGEVTEPGVQPLLHGMTLSQAIHHAGGFLKTARRSQVVVIRRHADGQVTGHAVDLTELEDDGHPEHDVALQPLDQVYVPKSRIANVNVLVEQYLKNNIPVNSFGLGITPF